jgi:hypothetical protein
METDKFKFEFQHIVQYTVWADDEDDADRTFGYVIEAGTYSDDVVKSGELLVRTQYPDRRNAITHMWDWKENIWKPTA